MDMAENGHTPEGAAAADVARMALKKKLKKMVSMPSRWILLDSTGDGSTMDVDRYEIMAQFGVHARDLRILDPLLSYPSTILGRSKAIILNLEHIKAVITPEVVLLRDPMDDNVVPIVEELRRRMSREDHDTQEDDDGPLPLELRALEVALEGVCSFLDARTIELEMEAYPALDQLTTKISARSLDRVRRLKGGMTGLTARVRKVKDELERLLDDDNDMVDLCLSRGQQDNVSIRSGGSLISTTSAMDGEGNYVEQVEMLLEVYFSQIDDTLRKLMTLRKYIDDTEDYTNIRLDNRRNRLIQMELFLNSGTLCLTLHSMITAIFGMSLHQPWNKDHGYMFKWVVIFSTLLCGLLYGTILSCSRRRGIIGSCDLH